MFTQSRNYCFTDFKNINFDFYEKIYNEYKDIIRYICVGIEICPKTKKQHIQGWIQFFNKKRIGGVKRCLNNKSLHCESMRGTAFDNDKYCSKDKKFKKFGAFIKQGHRSDLEKIKKDIKDGASKEEIMDNNFELYCRYRNGINDYMEIINKKKCAEFRKVKVEYLHGETGTGKTRHAMKKAKFKICANDLKWWDGYNGEKCIVIDDYDNDVNITKMLNILDGYQLRLPIKGGFTYANWNKVYITSNLDPDELHIHAKKKHRDALFRRITKVCRFATGNTINCSKDIKIKEFSTSICERSSPEKHSRN